MSKFCSQCGNELSDESMFCSMCGYSSETTEKINPSQPNVEIGSQASMPPPTSITPLVNKKNLLKIIIPIIAIVLVGAMSLGIVFFIGNTSVVTKNADGEKVFNFTAEKFVELYNSTNDSDLKFSYFEKDFNSDGDLIYTFADNLIVLFVGEKDYNDKVELIKLNIETPEYEVPNGVIYLLRTIYPELTISEAKDIASNAENSYIGQEYKDIEVTYTYDEDDDYESWYISPKE